MFKISVQVSGPNEGQNNGPFDFTSSGTIGAAYNAIERGVSSLSSREALPCIDGRGRFPRLPYLQGTTLIAHLPRILESLTTPPTSQGG